MTAMLQAFKEAGGDSDGVVAREREVESTKLQIAAKAREEFREYTRFIHSLDRDYKDEKKRPFVLHIVNAFYFTHNVGYVDDWKESGVSRRQRKCCLCLTRLKSYKTLRDSSNGESDVEFLIRELLRKDIDKAPTLALNSKASTKLLCPSCFGRLAVWTANAALYDAGLHRVVNQINVKKAC